MRERIYLQHSPWSTCDKCDSRSFQSLCVIIVLPHEVESRFDGKLLASADAWLFIWNFVISALFFEKAPEFPIKLIRMSR